MRGAIEMEKLAGVNLLKPFLVRGWVNGKRRRKQYKTEAEALTVKQNWEREIANLEPVPMVATRLTPAQAAEAESVFARLAGGPLTLTKAVDYAILNYRPASVAKSVADAVTLFLDEQELLGCAEDTMRNLKARLRPFVGFVNMMNVSDVSPDTIKAYLWRPSEKPRAARTIVNDRLVLSNFFNWCMAEKQKFTASNPVLSVKPPKLKGRKPPVTLTLAQSRKLVHEASQYNDGEAVPYFVLCLFGGVRPTECQRVTWEMFDWKRKRLDLGPDVTKTAEHRYVSLSPNMIEWLEPHALKKTPVRVSRYAFDRVRHGLGLAKWPEDIMRHTAVSNYLPATWENEKGHSDRQATDRHGHSISTMLKHYRDRVTPEDCAAFWEIRPGNIGELVTLPLEKAA